MDDSKNGIGGKKLKSRFQGKKGREMRRNEREGRKGEKEKKIF